MKRTLGIDFGRRRIGVAVSDALGMTAQALTTLSVRGRRDACRKLSELIVANEIGTIVMGLPLNMDGTRGEMVDEVERLAHQLTTETGHPVEFWDERMTSQAASRVIRTSGQKAPGGAVDRIAACLILEGYLKSKRP